MNERAFPGRNPTTRPPTVRAPSRDLLACGLLAAVALAADLPGQAGLPPMDRDEPRFAQASKQMLESGDFLNIRFQGEARNKKPAGIYWMQAAAVAAGNALGVADARTAIWLYRLPSLAGAVATVLLTTWAGLALASRCGAALAGLLVASTVLLAVEARLATTDAVVAATVAAAMGALARAWTGRHDAKPLGLTVCAAFWTALGVGILIKGPITPMIPLLAATALSVRHRSARWLLALRPAAGLAWCVLIAAPWFVLTFKASGTAFFRDAIGHDMAAKVAGGQESHGAPPGTYLLAFWLTAWPLAPFAVLGARAVWHERGSDAVAFLLAWLVPAWLLFELVPTKLPHYVLPLYPAVAILAARTVVDREPAGRWRLAATAVLLIAPILALPVLLALAGGSVASHVGGATVGAATLAVAASLGASAVAIRALQKGAGGLTAGFGAAAAAVALYGFVFGWFLNAGHADRIAVSRRLVQAGRRAVPACPRPDFASAGDREPSLVFLAGTDLVLTDGAGAARFLSGGPCRVALVENREEAGFAAALGPDAAVTLRSRVAGLNINGGKTLDVGVYVRQDTSP